MEAFQNHPFFLFFFLITALLIIQNSNAYVAEYDEYTLNRFEQAINSSKMAYNPNPEKVTERFNEQVGEALLGDNSTRRHLGGKGECKATNPIDRCWRCDPNWAANRKKLADCAHGFAYKTVGGKHGSFYIVHDSSDDDVVNPKPGTLRHAVLQEKPLWIIFSKSMVIRLQQELIMTSDKTIDGRGVNVHIAYGAGVTLQFVKNIIIHGIRIHHTVPGSGGLVRDSASHIGLRTRSDGDGISIFCSNNIWIDHVSLQKCTDGLIDVVQASTALTISNCKFNNHNEVMLLGATDGYTDDKILQVTLAFNRFGKGLIQRMPRCRWGFFHVVNNDYSHWQMYAIGGSSNPTIISQGNRFKASDDLFTKEVTKRDYAYESEWMNWQWRSEGDVFLNGAFFVESGPPLKHSPLTALNNIKAKPGSYVTRLTRYAGQLKCKIRQAC